MRESASENSPKCRFCDSTLSHTFVDLGMSPLCERYIERSQLKDMEPFFPVVVHVCENCLLVQLEEVVSAVEIFKNYAYFSSYSDTWLRHAKAYADMITDRLQLGGIVKW